MKLVTYLALLGATTSALKFKNQVPQQREVDLLQAWSDFKDTQNIGGELNLAQVNLDDSLDQYGSYGGYGDYSDPYASDPYGYPNGNDPYYDPYGTDPYGGAGGYDPYGDPYGNDPYYDPYGEDPYGDDGTSEEEDQLLKWIEAHIEEKGFITMKDIK